MRSMTAELESVRKEAAVASSEQKTAQKKIEMLMKEKGVAMRDNAASYQQSIQMETQVQCASNLIPRPLRRSLGMRLYTFTYFTSGQFVSKACLYV